MKIEPLPLEANLPQAQLEDFWQRQNNALAFQREVLLFGHTVLVRSNESNLLTAVNQALPHYTQTAALKPPLGEIHLVAQRVAEDLVQAPPPDLMQRITYSGSEDWLMMKLGAWGMAYLDLDQKKATAVLDPTLVQQPVLVSQCLLHTLFLNMLIASGYGMLHASCLIAGDTALLLLAPHNTGKSTTALRLTLSGMRLLTDSMVFVDQAGYLHGFPVGFVKLRRDVLSYFPELVPLLQREIVRDETKYRVDLRALDSGYVQEAAVKPGSVLLCLLGRRNDAATILHEITPADLSKAILENSLYVDQPATWEANLANLQRFLVGGTAVSLQIGTDSEQLLAAVKKLLP